MPGGPDEDRSRDASQLGTLPRLIHAVELGLVTAGWAIDENTVPQVEGDEITIF